MEWRMKNGEFLMHHSLFLILYSDFGLFLSRGRVGVDFSRLWCLRVPDRVF